MLSANVGAVAMVGDWDGDEVDDLVMYHYSAELVIRYTRTWVGEV